MSLEAKGSAVSRNKHKRQESSVHTPLHTRRIHVCMHVLYECTLCMYSMYVLVVEHAQGRSASLLELVHTDGFG